MPETITMSETILLRIYDIVGGPFWISQKDGQKVYEKIVAAFKENRVVKLSFSGRENLITAFLNVAIGQLYSGDFTEDFLKTHLIPTEITDDDREMLNVVIANAKRYFADPLTYDEIWNDEISDEEHE